MQVLISCTECDYEEWGSTDKQLMNKIVMWNHVKKAHAGTAERIFRMYRTFPNHLYSTRQAGLILE